MTPKKKKSLDKKHKAQVTKYESELNTYLDALDDAKRCKYEEVSLVIHLYHLVNKYPPLMHKDLQLFCYNSSD